ncbi:MAG TPA: ATPase, T2SS/T4P/T4SS family, partial [Candidatus Kapabacteria bacterium]|nr:ATPase, T2SS/T4P/T4SS family [Candidatus Kapabacteria bacterium]
MKSLTTYFATALEKHASDIHLVAGEKPMLRIDGTLVDLEDSPLSPKELEQEIFSLLSPEQKKAYGMDLELDMSVAVEGARFRVNVHQQEEKIGLAARLIPETIPSPDDLRFEPALREFPNMLDGLVLVVGPTGSGKSTVIASMIEEINKTRKAHVI